METTTAAVKKASGGSLPKMVGALVVLALIGGGIWYGYQYYLTASMSPEEVAAEATAKQAAEENALVQDLMEKAGKHIALPVDETPLVFDVQDPEQLKSQQPFFAGVEKGDKLLVFQKSVKAVIYSPSRDIIVNAGPIQFDQNATPAGTKSQK